MSPTDELIPMLKKLRLSGVLQSLQLRTQQAVDDNLSHSEFLYRLLGDEVERRDSKQLSQRVRRAPFEHARTLEVTVRRAPSRRRADPPGTAGGSDRQSWLFGSVTVPGFSMAASAARRR
jgi:hypothetical protein